MKQGQILFCDIETDKGIKVNVVYTIGDQEYKHEKFIKVIKTHKVLGYRSNIKEYTEVKKSNEKRNTITGAYD